MLIATFLTNIFYSATYPYIHKVIMQSVTDNVIALSQIINCVSIVFFGALWNKLSWKLFGYYPLICIAETVCSISSTIFAILTGNILTYYLLDTLIFAFVTRNICCGGIKLRALRYPTDAEREHFDNNSNSAAAIATILGSVLAIILSLDFNVTLCLATFGNCIDNIMYIFIYYKTLNNIPSKHKDA